MRTVWPSAAVIAVAALVTSACFPSFADLQGGAPPVSDGSAGQGTCPGSQFCSAFDPPAAVLPFGWASSRGDPSGFVLVGAEGTSTPNALRLQAAESDVERWLVTTFGPSVSNVTFAFQLRVDALGGAKASDVVVLRLGCVATALDVKLKRTGRLQLQSGMIDTLQVSAPAPGFVGVSVAWDLAGGRATLVLGNDAPLMLTTVAGACPTPLMASFGMVDLGATRSGTFDFRVDDVHASWK